MYVQPECVCSALVVTCEADQMDSYGLCFLTGHTVMIEFSVTGSIISMVCVEVVFNKT